MADALVRDEKVKDSQWELESMGRRGAMLHSVGESVEKAQVKQTQDLEGSETKIGRNGNRVEEANEMKPKGVSYTSEKRLARPRSSLRHQI